MGYKDADTLRELYVEKRLSQSEVADELNCSTATVCRWLEKSGIESRSFNDGRLISLRTRRDGYEEFGAGVGNVLHHRLLAVAEFGFDAVANKHVHHKSGIPWDNRPDNIELMTNSQHLKKHGKEKGGDWRDEDVLHELYIERDLSGPQIADELGCSARTVYNWLERYGIA